jgi:hypothetical protein
VVGRWPAHGCVRKPGGERSGVAEVVVTVPGDNWLTCAALAVSPAPAPVGLVSALQKAFRHGRGATAIATTTPSIVTGFPGVFVAVAIGVTVRSPLPTQTVLPSRVMATA